MQKTLTFMLHAHIPYVLQTEVEYWLHEVALHSYLPLLRMLKRLDTNKELLTINLSPILLVQLSSPIFKENFKKYISIRKEILSVDLHDEEKNNIFNKDKELVLELEDILTQFDYDIIKGFQYYVKKGNINIITSAATHPFFPSFMNFPNIVNTQISLGKQITESFFSNIKGFWVPECALTPALGKFLCENDIQYTFADPTSLQKEDQQTLLYQDHYGVNYLCRDYLCTAKIWDVNTGYPSHVSYREFHSDVKLESEQVLRIIDDNSLPLSGVSIRAITDKESNDKAVYSHEKAITQNKIDAEHYKRFLDEQLRHKMHITVCFDAELFGHWWKDGINFLELLFRNLKNTNISLGLPSFVGANIRTPNLSTWGKNCNSESWINEQTKSIWEHLVKSACKVENLFVSQQLSSEILYEFLLQQASDWPFLVTYNSFPDLSKKMSMSSYESIPENILFQLIKKNLEKKH